MCAKRIRSRASQDHGDSLGTGLEAECKKRCQGMSSLVYLFLYQGMGLLLFTRSPRRLSRKLSRRFYQFLETQESRGNEKRTGAVKPRSFLHPLPVEQFYL